MMLCDAHAHLGNDTEWEERIKKGILSLVCATGPDVWWNSAVARAAKQISQDRLLVETDGLGAVQWAYENGPEDRKRTVPGTVSEALENTVRIMSDIREISLEAMEGLVFDNLASGFLRDVLFCGAEKSL